MGRYLSLLRGINVSGQKKIRMADLRGLYTSLGFTGVESYIQSGNVVFDSDLADRVGLRRQIESAIEKQYGFSVRVILRTREELQRIIQDNPFLHDPAAPAVAHAALYVCFFDIGAGGEAGAPPDGSAAALAKTLEPLREVASGEDRFEVSRSEVYIYCPGGYGKTKYTNNVFEKAAGLTATTRNWKTVYTLLDL